MRTFRLAFFSVRFGPCRSEDERDECHKVTRAKAADVTARTVQRCQVSRMQL
jgi:hypothetical protein